LNGNILRIEKKAGDSIEVGDTLLIMHAMKLETEVASQVRGKVLEVKVNPDDQVATNDVLVVVEGQELLEESMEDEHAGVRAQSNQSQARSLANQSLAVWYTPEALAEQEQRGMPVLKSAARSTLGNDKAMAKKEQNEKLAAE